MSDTIFSTTSATASAAAWRKQVTEAFKLAREGDLLALGALPLAASDLVTVCLLQGEPATLDVRGRILRALLQWAVDKLRPGGAFSWTLPAWRAYNVLHSYYFQGLRAADLAEQLAVAEQTLYQWRSQALATVAHLLQEELLTPHDRQGRQFYACAERYQRCTADEQQLLRITALFTSVLPLPLLHQLAETVDVQTISASLQRLIASHLLLSDEQQTTVALHAELRPYLLTLLQPEARRLLHAVAGDYYRSQGDALTAAHHLRAASEFVQAATLLIEQQRALVDSRQLAALSLLIEEFRPHEVPTNVWAQLKIVAGELAEFTHNIDRALAEYQQALLAPDLTTKATAYYRRAKAFEQKNSDEALAHYAYAIRLLEERRSDQGRLARVDLALLVRLYIQRAWIFLQVRPDQTQAAADLQRAQALSDPTDRQLWSDLYNALGEFYHRQGQPTASVDHYWQAWLAANEVLDRERLSQTAHNLGLVYMADLQQYDRALEYLRQSQTLAEQTGNRPMVGLCAKSIGACYFWLNDLPAAIAAYETAAAIFRETGNGALQARIAYDLAEAQVLLGELDLAQQHYQNGLALATALGDVGALADFAQLAQQQPQLVRPTLALNERQQQALAYIRAHGQITNRDYQQLTGVAQKQTVRDLNELVEQALLVRIGSGRATRYVLK